MHHHTPSNMTMNTPEHTAEVAIDISPHTIQAVVDTSAVNDDAQTTSSDEIFVTPNKQMVVFPYPFETTVDPVENTIDTATDFSSSIPKSPNDSRKRSRSETPPPMNKSTTNTDAAIEINQSLTPASTNREIKRIRAKSPDPTVLKTTPPATINNPPMPPPPPSFTISPTQDRTTAIKSARQAIAAPDTLPSGRHQLVYFLDAARNHPHNGPRRTATRQGARPGSYAVISKDFGSDGRRWSTLAYDIPHCFTVEQALKTAICEAMGHALENIDTTDALAREGCHIVIFADNVSCIEHLEEAENRNTIHPEDDDSVVVHVGGSNDVRDYYCGRTGAKGFQRYITRPIDYAIAETARDLVAAAACGSEWELRDRTIRRSRVSVELRWIPRGVIGQQMLADDLARGVDEEEEGAVLLFKRCLATRGVDDGVALAVAEWRALRDGDRRRKVEVGRLIQLQELESEHGWLGLTLEESGEMRDLERRVGHLVDSGIFDGLKPPDYGMEWLGRG